MKQTNDEKEIIDWQRGVEYGKKHSEPSPKTIELFKEFEKKFDDYIITHQKQHDELKAILTPVVKTYEGVAFMSGTLGKVLVTISIISGLIWGWFAFGKDWFK